MLRYCDISVKLRQRTWYFDRNNSIRLIPPGNSYPQKPFKGYQCLSDQRRGQKFIGGHGHKPAGEFSGNERSPHGIIGRNGKNGYFSDSHACGSFRIDPGVENTIHEIICEY